MIENHHREGYQDNSMNISNMQLINHDISKPFQFPYLNSNIHSTSASSKMTFSSVRKINYFYNNNNNQHNSHKSIDLLQVDASNETGEKLIIDSKKKMMLANYKLKLLDDNNSESNNLSVTNGEPTSNGHEIKREGKFYKMSTGQKKNFISNPIDEGIWLRGKIVYTHNKNEKIFKYYIEHNQDILIMTARNVGRKHFLIYSDDMLMHRIGKISTNFLGKNYKVYLSQNNTIISTKSSMNSNANKICSIKYSLNLFGLSGPLKLRITLHNDENIVYHNKPPSYNKKYNCYVLNYINRSIKTSEKNFQLVDDTKKDREEILLQFGETKNVNNYIIDYKYPFSPLQAFSIGISCINS